MAKRHGAPVRFLGRVTDEDLPGLDAAADVWAMCCRDRWFGLEQEGFGIVFLEAAAAGVAQLAGRSGGSDEAVVDGRPGSWSTGRATRPLLRPRWRAFWTIPSFDERLGAEARRRAVAEFDYDRLARTLHEAPGGDGWLTRPLGVLIVREGWSRASEVGECWPRARGDARLESTRAERRTCGRSDH